ncbi:MAG: phosphate ABC transporter substrate-binding protein [Anaerolineae bacterium]|nr:MAG: phosphate ABC transporter substrate-binding protein [Anaerolineae bacterium]
MYRNIFVLVSLVVMAALVLSACGGPADTVSAAQGEEALSGTITISGAFALYPMMTRWAEEFQKLHPAVQFDISAGGAGKGMTDALSGAVDIGMVSRGIKPEEEAQGAYAIAVTKDAVFPVVNANNPVAAQILAQGISQQTFVDIYITGQIKTWGQVVGRPEITDEIHLYTRADACGAAEMWAKFTGNKKQEDLLGIGVNGDPGVLEAVLKDPLGMGYNNLGYVFDLASGQAVKGALIVPIDLNQDGKADDGERIETLPEAMQAVAEGKYPSPPARLLYVVTKNKPVGIVQAFIEWILTDGQAFVGEAGYVQLTTEQLKESLQRLR